MTTDLETADETPEAAASEPAGKPEVAPEAVPASEPAPVDGEALPSDEASAPTDEASAPTDEESAPTDEESAPTDEASAPTDETSAPTDETSAPTDEESAPTDEASAPTDEENAPADEKNAPASEESVKPADGESAPAEPAAADSRQSDKAPAQKKKKSKPEKKPEIKVPEYVDLNDFQKESLTSLHAIAQEIGLRVAGVRSKHQLVFEILKFYGKRGSRIEAQGFLDYNGEAYGFLRWPELSFSPNVDDVYVSPNFIRKLALKPGHLVRAAIRPPKDREKFLSVEEIVSVEGIPAEEWETPPDFDKLTALFPDDRIILEHHEIESPSPRVVDLIAPLGKGQRGLIVAPPRGGKTILLKSLAVAIQKNHPEVELIVLLLDERPEEVTDFEETVDAAVFSSTFDESPKRHVQVADMVAHRARRLVELKKDVVILLDSLTRLARGHNSAVQGGKGGGRMGSGGLDTKALQRPRKFFGAARNVEEGGSLTILATCLIETDSRMDEVIFEEFKGTGNMEITLDRELAEKRVYPAIHSLKSGTRKDDLLYHTDELPRVNAIRKQLAQLPAGEAMETLVKNIQLTNTNAELLLRGIR